MLDRLHRIGSGCGLEIRGDALVATAVKSRPGGVTWLGSKRIEGFEQRQASEWGAELIAFLQECGVSHVAASFVLPRRDVIVRLLHLPPMSAKEREAAVRYQLDGLHPFADDEIYFTFAPLAAKTPGPSPVAVAIVEKSVVDRYADLLEEAGVAAAAFTVSSSALYAAVRMRPGEAPKPLLVALREGDDLEIYGESAGRPLLNADFNLRSVPAERALQLALSDLRLADDETAVFVAAGEPIEADLPAAIESRAAAEVFPSPLDAADDFDFSRDLSGLAGALESACPRLGWRANLLPPERRKSDSRLLWAPTAALVMLLLLLGVGFLVRPWIQNARYAAALEQRTMELETIAGASDKNRAATAEVASKIEILEQLQARTRQDLQVVSELSLLVPDTAWLSQLAVLDTGVQLFGQAASAAPLLGVLSQAATIEKAAFSRSLVKEDDFERFQITAARRLNAPAPEAGAASAQAVSVAAADGSRAMTTLGEEEATPDQAESSSEQRLDEEPEGQEPAIQSEEPAATDAQSKSQPSRARRGGSR